MIAEIKKEFFTYRNGMLADTLRRYGMPHKVIFGLEVPRLAEIARGLTPSEELADMLWADSEVRESRLLACWLYPLDSVPADKCIALAGSARTAEEAQMLAFRIFKRLPFAASLLEEFEKRRAGNEAFARAADALAAHL